MALGIDPTVDYAFKRLFGDPIHSGVLIHLLNAIFEGEFEVSVVQILTPFLDKDFEEDKLAILDLRVRDTGGRQYNLEMQTSIPAGLPHRLAYYVSSMYSEQLHQGDPYTQLCPAISVCFLSQILFAQLGACHTRFRLSSLEHGLVLTDHLEVHLLELPKYNGTAADMAQAGRRDKWLYFLRHAAEMSVEEIARLLVEPAYVEAAGVLELIARTTEDRLRYELRIKALRDQATNLEAARAEGRLEGREIGELIGCIRALQELLGVDVDTSDELSSWEQDRLERLAGSLRDQLRGGSPPEHGSSA